MSEHRKQISIIVPFYNEGEGIDYFYEAICPIFSQVSDMDFEVVCIDDGSSDDTLKKLISVTEKDPRFVSTLNLMVNAISNRHGLRILSN